MSSEYISLESEFLASKYVGAADCTPAESAVAPKPTRLAVTAESPSLVVAIPTPIPGAIDGNNDNDPPSNSDFVNPRNAD